MFEIKLQYNIIKIDCNMYSNLVFITFLCVHEFGIVFGSNDFCENVFGEKILLHDASSAVSGVQY